MVTVMATDTASINGAPEAKALENTDTPTWPGLSHGRDTPVILGNIRQFKKKTAMVACGMQSGRGSNLVTTFANELTCRKAGYNLFYQEQKKADKIQNMFVF